VTTTFGTGQLIAQALERGCRDFVIGIGGSATNDGGVGMAEALGARFLDADGNMLPPGGGSLARLHHIDLSKLDARIRESEITVACDVTNPLCGPLGAAAVYGPQKGASAAMVRILDANLRHLAQCIKAQLGVDVVDLAGGGAAGGLGAGLVAFLGARLEKGFPVVSRAVGLEEAIARAALVITGEGQVDGQTLFGKAVHGVAELARRYDVPVIVLGGAVQPEASQLYEKFTVVAVQSIVNAPMDLDAAMANAAELLEQSAERCLRLVRLGVRLARSYDE